MNDEFAQAMRAEFRQLSIKGVATMGTGLEADIEPGDIVSVRVSEGSDTGILPGNVLTASCTIVLDDSRGAWRLGGAKRGAAPLVGATFALEMGVLIAGEMRYTPMGVYVCDEELSDENSPIITLNCHDSIYTETAYSFIDGLTYPRTLGEIWAHIISQTRYTFSASLPNAECVIDSPPDWGEISVRTAMGYVAAAAGGFVRVSRAGELEFAPLISAEAPISIAPAHYISRRRSQTYFGPVNALEITTVNHREDLDSEIETITVAPEISVGANTLTVKGNPLFISGGAHTLALAQAMRDALSGLTYRQSAFTWRGDPELMPGARLNVTGVNGDSVECMLSRQTLNFENGLYAECTCGVPDTDEMASRAVTPEGGVDAGRLIGIISGGNIAADSITAVKIAAGAITADKIDAGAITADKIAAGAITAGKIDAKTITAEQCVANMITAQSGLIAVGAIETAQIADGSITSAKIVSLNADVIESGTLKTDRLLLVGEGGVIYEINAASSGLSQSELSKEQYQNYINGTVIVANSITAAQIAAGAITANEIAANAVTAAKVNIADLFAAQATINAINAMDISSNTYLKLFVGQSIDAVSVGGRNLLLNTASPNSLTGTGNTNEGKTFYWLSQDYTGNRPKQGEYLTLSFNWSTTATSGTITPQWNNTPYNMTAPAITISASNKAGHYTYTWQMRASDVSGTYTGVQMRLDNVSGTVMISGMKLERGNKATDWTPAPEDPVEALKNSTVTIMPDEVTITTPQFNVDIQKDIASEASRALQIDSDGIRAQTIISDSVVGALPGGNYTVGTGGDYARLEDAIAEINDRHIRGDVYIQLRDWDIGENPTIAGVTGSGRIYLMPQNLMDINSGARWESQGATASANLGASVAPFTGVTVTAQSAGTYRGALLHQGYAGPMGIIGKTLTISANIEGSSGTVPNIVTYLGGKGLQWLGPATSGAAANTYTGFIRIPETAGFWDELTFLFRINATTSVNAGAQGFFRSLRLEIGDGLGETSYPSYAQLAGLKVENCAAEVIVKGLKLSGAILARHSHVTAICCGMYADTGMRAWGGSGGMVDCYGVCATIAEGAGGGAIEVYGVAPSGNTLGSVDTSRITDRDSSGTPPSGGKSISVYAQTTGTYDTTNGWWSSDRALRQGYTASNGRMRGGMWFDLSALPSGATITKLTLRLKRVAGFGKGAPVDIRIYGTTAEARTGDPAASGKISSAFVTGSISQDVTKSFDITALKAYSGFVLYATDTSLLSGKTYSTNYAKFTGTGGGDSTRPMLTVRYTT